MSPDPGRFDEAIARFDAAHAEDPEKEVSRGAEHPKELLYAQRMSAWLAALAPDASEPLKLAVRAQHLRRWSIPRSAYPMDVEGYRRWRTDEARSHAETAGRILEEVGYDEATIRRVQALVRKERLKQDPEAQLLEDVSCIVFLENYFAGFAQKHDQDTLVRILRKTWKKMSAKGHEAALGLELSPQLRAIVEKALPDT
ncbi:MAG TPA: DUF4202 domain-containing protein [Burkholderiales bacterium]|nr:DUF4202 domain-containing protein [Burkholderiales bacterium]